MTKYEVDLDRAIGGLSKPSKMPSYSYSLPASRCKVGGKLRAVKGSTCAGCYAMKGRYVFSNVQSALTRRLDALNADRLAWEHNMVKLINSLQISHFRWHDSGDLQDADHLLRIIAIATATPGTMHWLTTKEYALVRQYITDGGFIPSNLCIRISAPMVNRPAPSICGLPVANVHDPKAPALVGAGFAPGYACTAPSNGGKCGDCRACWAPTVPVVTYRKH